MIGKEKTYKILTRKKLSVEFNVAPPLSAYSMLQRMKYFSLSKHLAEGLTRI